MNQEPDSGNLMPDTFVDLGNNSYGAAIDDYQPQMNDYDLRGPNAQFIASNASYDDENTGTGGNSGTGGGGGSGIPDPGLEECEAALEEALEEIEDLEEALEEACEQAPDAGSWSYNRNVYRISNSGSCSGYAHFQRESYNASLAKNITFLGNTIGNGYRIINNNTAVALYRVYNVGSSSPNYRRVVPVRTDQLNTDGSALCNSGMVGIALAKVNPAQPSGYDSQQGGIAAGAAGIGTYGVFARTLDTIDGTGPWYPDGPQGVSSSTLIGTITKAGEEDIFDYASESSNPCGDKPPPFYTVNYAAGAGGTVTGLSTQYITPDGTGTLITAVPNPGYTFTGWSDGSTIAGRQDSNPTSNGTLTANFVLTP